MSKKSLSTWLFLIIAVVSKHRLEDFESISQLYCCKNLDWWPGAMGQCCSVVKKNIWWTPAVTLQCQGDFGGMKQTMYVCDFFFKPKPALINTQVPEEESCETHHVPKTRAISAVSPPSALQLTWLHLGK